MTNEQIKHMVNRFLGWKLPADFSPDGGISATRPNYAPGVSWEPVGTNLLDFAQAEAMVRYMLDGVPKEVLERNLSACAHNAKSAIEAARYSEGDWGRAFEKLDALLDACDAVS